METTIYEKAGLIVTGLILLLLLVMCAGPKKVAFDAECENLCKNQDSKVLYCNQEKKVVVCE